MFRIIFDNCNWVSFATAVRQFLAFFATSVIWKFVVGLFAIVCLSGSVSAAPPGTMIDVGGYRLHIDCHGYGTPTVVFDVGLGGSSLEWQFVVEQTRSFTRVCTYDRAGYGWSDMGPRPRTSSKIVNELFLLLDGIDHERPFILVGHSYGGYNVQLFSRRYPYLVAGLVLVDSSHPEQVERFLAPPIELNTAPSSRWGIVQFSDPPIPHKKLPLATKQIVRARSIHWKTRRTLAREYLSFRQSARQVRRAGSTPTIPSVVITRGKRVWPKGDKGNLIEALWVDLQSELAQQSVHSAHVIARDSGHQVHIDQPQIVAYSIGLLTNQFRRQANQSRQGEYQALSDLSAINFGDAIWLRDTLPQSSNPVTSNTDAVPVSVTGPSEIDPDIKISRVLSH